MAWAYNIYSRGAYGWHFGIWDGTVTSIRDASLNCNRKLASGADLGPSSRVLDVGCGVGGFAIWAAKQFGCHVTGITIVPENIASAEQRAKRLGVSDRVTFKLMDMADFRFEDESFDLITNQETLCYAVNKPKYFADVHRLLKPGGRWQSVDLAIKEGPLTPEEESLHKQVCELWYMAPLEPLSAIEAKAKKAGFEQTRAEDVTPLVLRDARRIMGVTRIGKALAKYNIDNLLFRQPGMRDEFRRHMAAGAGYAFFSAQKRARATTTKGLA
jgi:tocopherol O-methyltransferase